MGTKVIGCRLPHGLTLNHNGKKVQINGLNSAPRVAGGGIVVIPYATTIIDADVWDAFVAKKFDYAPLKNGALFECKDLKEAAAMAKDFSQLKTGFEPMGQLQSGIKPADAKE